MSMPVIEFYEKYYEPLLLLHSNPNTTRQYRTNIKRLTDLLERIATLADITRDNMIALQKRMIAAKKSPATANKTVSQLRALLNEAVRRNMASHDRLPRLKEYRRAPTAWTSEQIDRIYAVCRKQEGMIEGVLASEWWVALHNVLLDTGIRVGSALRLTWEHLDWGRKVLMVPAEIQKDDTDQSFQLHPDTVSSLFEIRKPKREVIFPYIKTYSIIWYRYGAMLKEAGLPNTRRDKFHRMRRTVATLYENAGGNATELLGHSSRDTTRRYLDEQMINRLNPCDVIERPKTEGGDADA